MIEYLNVKYRIYSLIAYVMPENIYSVKVLLANGFTKENYTKEEHNWGCHEIVVVDVYKYVFDYMDTMENKEK